MVMLRKKVEHPCYRQPGVPNHSTSTIDKSKNVLMQLPSRKQSMSYCLIGFSQKLAPKNQRQWLVVLFEHASLSFSNPSNKVGSSDLCWHSAVKLSSYHLLSKNMVQAALASTPAQPTLKEQRAPIDCPRCSRSKRLFASLVISSPLFAL